MAFGGADALPLDNLDGNIKCEDALFCIWPEVDAIIGNPPFQSKNKMIEEFGRGYVNRIRAAYPDIPGRADYCVYWFRKAHDHLGHEQRAGLVGTNTIRQNYSRIGGLDYIVNHGGTITEAVSSQVWSGDAVVHVSIVNLLKGSQPGKKKLLHQRVTARQPVANARGGVNHSALAYRADLKTRRPFRQSEIRCLLSRSDPRDMTAFCSTRLKLSSCWAETRRLPMCCFRSLSLMT